MEVVVVLELVEKVGIGEIGSLIRREHTTRYVRNWLGE